MGTVNVHFTRHALGICAVFAMLTGCGGAPSQLGEPGMLAQPSAVGNPATSGSQMTPDAKKRNLLYISDQGSRDVYVFSYPQGKLVGTLTGFNEPAGECADKAGNVFITDAFAKDIVEYAHGGKTPIATLSEAGEFPSGCAVDPTTGNLAVTNYCSGDASACTGPGSVGIFVKASGSPTQFTDPKISNQYFGGYDNKGNLFVDGTKGSAFAFAKLPRGHTSLINVKLNQAIQAPGAVQWDGAHVAVGDQKSGVIYQFAITGKTGTEFASTSLLGSNQVVQFWLQPPNVIGPNAGSANAMYWNYPAGGSSTKTIGGLNRPVGATVSLAQ